MKKKLALALSVLMVFSAIAGNLGMEVKASGNMAAFAETEATPGAGTKTAASSGNMAADKGTETAAVSEEAVPGAGTGTALTEPTEKERTLQETVSGDSTWEEPEAGDAVTREEETDTALADTLSAETLEGATAVVAKDYPTLPKGYEISRQFTYDTDGNCDDASCTFDGKSKKMTLGGMQSETRYSIFNEGDGIVYDGSGFSFWYKSDAACTFAMEGMIWLYLDAAPEGRWVTYYYQGKIFYDNDMTQSVKYKSDMNPNISSKIDPEKKYNITFYRGEGDYYIDEVFTFKPVKTAADQYENDEQAFKFSLDRYEWDKNTSADYMESGDANGSVALFPTPGLTFTNNPVNITYRMSDADKVQFQKAVEIAKEGSGYLQITCEDLMCKTGDADQFAKICLTIKHVEKKTNEKTGQTEYVDKKLTKWIIGSGSFETFLINVKDINDFSELNEICVEIYTSGVDGDQMKFRFSPITVYHYPEDEIILDTDWLKNHTTQDGEKLPKDTALATDEGGDTNRQFLHIPNKRASVTEIELPQLPVGEYEVYANMLLDTSSKALCTLAVNNRIQDMDKHFQLWFQNSNAQYTSHKHIENVSMGKINITKNYQDGPTRLKLISFYGSGAAWENTEMFISYLSFKKTSTSVTAEPSENFLIKDYPEPEDYEKRRVLNDYNEFVRSGDNRYNKEQQVYGYVGDREAYNLNSRKSMGVMEPAVNLIWSDAEKGLDGSALRFWLKFDMDAAQDTYSAWLSLFDNSNRKVASVSFEVTKSGEQYVYQTKYKNQVIGSGDYDVENGIWATLYYRDIVENGDLSNVTKIGMTMGETTTSCHVDELHTIQQKLGDILYEKNADGKAASVTGYHLRIEDAEILERYENVPVTAIKEGALSKTLTLKSVELPESVETIEADAFAGDLNLAKINLDDGVKSIGDGAFKDCKKLGETRFSQEVTSIGDNAFDGCDNLIMVVPYNSYAYNYAVENNRNYRTTLGDYDFYKIDGEIHIAEYIGTKDNVVIPEQMEGLPVTAILPGAFAGKNVKNISSTTVTSIGKEAFCECPVLEKAIFSNLNSVDEKAFYSCKALQNVALGEKITTIKEHAFEGDCALVRLVLPESLTYIEASAFAGCSDKLVADVVRDSYAYQFVNTRDTAMLQIPDTESDYQYSLWLYEATIIGYRGNGTRLEIPGTIDGYTVVSVGENSFKNNTQITYVTFPNNCKTIGDSAFYGCSRLEGFAINAVLQLGHHTFQSCPKLAEVTITNVTKYWNDTFDSGVKIKINESQFHRTAMELTNSWHAGINLGCKFDTAAYDTYGKYTSEEARNFLSGDVTREYIRLLSDSGFDVVRFPITWTAFVDDNNNYTIDEGYLDRIQEIVDWMIAEDMYVIINTHHDSSEYDLEKGWLNLYNYSEETCRKYERIWEQISERFQDYDEHLIFESLNEPRYGSEWDPKTAGANDNLNDLQQRFYRVVRNSGGNNAQRYLMLETYAAACKAAQCSQFVSDWQETYDKDNHLMVSVHFYNNNIGEGNFDYAIALCKKYFNDNNIACVMGESATVTHFPLSELRDNTEKNANVIDIDYYEETGEIRYLTKMVHARDYDDWYVSTWLDKFLNVSDKYGVKLLYWEDSGSMTLGAKGENPWWYFPSAIDVFMNHGYHITVDGETMTLENLSFTLPGNPDVSYYTNGKARFLPGEEVKLSQVKENTEIVSVTHEMDATWLSDEESHWKEAYGEKQQHTFGDWRVTKEATCTEKGEKSHSCQVCKREVKVEIPGKGHTPQILGGRAATCEETGLTEGKKCTVCGEMFIKQEVIPAKEHHYVQTDYRAATTKDIGLITYTCTGCGAKTTTTLEKMDESKPLPVETAPSLSEMETLIYSMDTDEAPEGSLYHLLKFRASKVTTSSVKLKWQKVKGATGYIIYGNLCGKGYQKLKTVNGGSKVSATIKNLKKGKYYKFFVIALQECEGTQKVTATSKTVHIALQGGKAGNYKAVKLTNVKRNKLRLKQGKSFTIKAESVVQNKKQKVKKHRSLRYESTNSKIAKVNQKGKITANQKGRCSIYVYDQSGNYGEIKVTVK